MTKMKKKILPAFLCAALCTLCLLCALPVRANEFDIDYSGITDDVTGEPIGGDVILGDERVLISGYEYYDPTLRAFVFVLPTSGLEISSNVADGMVTTGKVSITVPFGLNAVLYRDGVAVTNRDFSGITEPGGYVLSVGSGSVDSQPLSFRIVRPVTGELDEYRLPSGFAVTEFLLNGQEQPFDLRSVDMSAEGRYQITYYCQPTALGFTLNVTVDHTAPTLKLEAVKDGVARSIVDLSDLPEDCTIYIEHDGKAMKYTEKLKESGSYSVTVTDPAGNWTTYKFVIQVYMNSWGTVLAVVAIALVAGLLIYLLVSRKRLQVR